VPIVRYFIFVGGALAALLLIAGWCLPMPPVMSADHLTIDRATIRIKSARKWPEKVVLDTSQPIIPPPAVEEAPAAQSVPLSSEEAGDQSNREAMAQLRPLPHRPLSFIQPRKSSAERQGPLNQSVALLVGWQERKRVETVVSLDGSIMVKQARMTSCVGTPRRHGQWIGRGSPGGIERWTVPVVAHGTAQ
jgi:hypothetical protein